MCAMPYADPASRRFVRLALSREAGALLATEIVCGCRMRVVGLFDIRVVGIPARALRPRRQVVGLRVLGDGA